MEKWDYYNTQPGLVYIVNNEIVGGVQEVKFGFIAYSATKTDGFYRTQEEAQRWVEENYLEV